MSAGLRRRLAAVVAAAAIALPLAACAPAEAARPVTTEESQVLAAMRFRNGDAGTRALEFTVQDAGRELTFAGWYDFGLHRGYGLLGDAEERMLLAWTPETVGVAPAAGAVAPLPVPEDATWSTSPVDAAVSRLHALTAVVAGLGSDRPDNPLLLQQSGALWIGTETVDGRPVTVFAGPPSDEPLPAGAVPDPDASRARYWVDDVGLLHRAEVRFGDEWVRLDFAAAEGIDLGTPSEDAG